MKKMLLLGLVLLALAFVVPADAQVCMGGAPGCPSGGGGSSSLTAGTTATSGCTDGAFIYSLTSLMQCGNLLTTNGSTFISKTVAMRAEDGAVGTPAYTFTSDTDTGFWWRTSGAIEIAFNGVHSASFANDGGFTMGAAREIGWSNAAPASNARDALWLKEAAAVIQQGVDLNGAAIAQTYKSCDGITGTNIAGCNLTFAGGRGTGTGAGGNLILQTSPALGTGTTAQTLQQREIIVGKQFNLTSGAIATFAVATLGNDTHSGGSIDYCVYGYDATTAVSECGRADFSAIDVTAGAGGEVCTFTKVGTPAQAVSGATLAVAFTGTTGTDLCSLRVTSTITTIASPTAHYIKYRIINHGLSSVNIVTPQ